MIEAVKAKWRRCSSIWTSSHLMHGHILGSYCPPGREVQLDLCGLTKFMDSGRHVINPLFRVSILEAEKIMADFTTPAYQDEQ